MAGQDRYEVILAGAGGQGLVLAGMVLGEAAILEGKNVVQTVSYGIASRGGFSQAEVIIDRAEIIFQQVEKPDIVLAMTKEAFALHRDLASAGSRIFYDSTLLPHQEGPGLLGHPYTRTAADLGHSAGANIVALGTIAAATGLVRVESLVQAVNGRFAPAAAAVNIAALHAGAGLIAAGGRCEG